MQVGAVLPGVDASALTGAARNGLHSAVGVLAVVAMIVLRKGEREYNSLST